MEENVDVSPFCIDPSKVESASQQIQNEMENRRKKWLKEYKQKLDLNDVLEIRNPQAVIEFIPEIIENMKVE